MLDRVGQQLDHYHFIRLLGAGGFGEVYLGEDVHQKTQVAIKVLPPLAQDDLQSFLTEIRTFRLKHPNIVKIFDFGIWERSPYIVMEYAPNGTLRQRHPKGTQVPLPTIVSYVKQIASALQFAHNEGVVHRDIKPENMLVGEREEVFLSDFGLAIVVQNSYYQSTQAMAGTIAYMAPEQILAHPSPASDQYSLGIVVYEWLCGERPFYGTLSEVAVKHTSVSPPSLNEKGLVLPPEVEKVVLKALAKNPKERFDNVQAFATALEMAWQTEQALSAATTVPVTKPTSVEQPTGEKHLVNPASGHPIDPNKDVPSTDASASESQIVPEASVPDVVPSASILKPPKGQEPEVSQFMARETPNNATSSRLAVPAKKGLSRRAVLTGLFVVAGGVIVSGAVTGLELSHKHLTLSQSSSLPSQPSATPSQPPPLSSQGLSLGTTLYTYRGHDFGGVGWGVLAVAWSPNGQRIASGADDKTVQVWDVLTGGHEYTFRGHYREVSGVAWSPDGQRIASCSWDGTVRVWDAADGRHRYTRQGNFLEAVAWSPDGRYIASGGFDGVQVWNSATVVKVYANREHADGVTAVAWSPNGQRIALGVGNTVQVWDATDGGHIYIYRGHAGFVTAVAWLPDGQRIASGSADNTVQVWDATDGGHVFTYRGHSSIVRGVAWSPDDKRIASGGNDKTVQVWDANGGSHIYIYRGHAGFVTAVAWSPDGQRIASGSADNTVQVWQAE